MRSPLTCTTSPVGCHTGNKVTGTKVQRTVSHAWIQLSEDLTCTTSPVGCHTGNKVTGTKVQRTVSYAEIYLSEDHTCTTSPHHTCMSHRNYIAVNSVTRWNTAQRRPHLHHLTCWMSHRNYIAVNSVTRWNTVQWRPHLHHLTSPHLHVTQELQCSEQCHTLKYSSVKTSPASPHLLDVTQELQCSEQCHTLEYSSVKSWNQSCYMTLSQYTDTRQTRPSTDPIVPDVRQDRHYSTNFKSIIRPDRSKWRPMPVCSALETDVSTLTRQSGEVQKGLVCLQELSET